MLISGIFLIILNVKAKKLWHMSLKDNAYDNWEICEKCAANFYGARGLNF
jgi:hypothetical protein